MFSAILQQQTAAAAAAATTTTNLCAQCRLAFFLKHHVD